MTAANDFPLTRAWREAHPELACPTHGTGCDYNRTAHPRPPASFDINLRPRSDEDDGLDLDGRMADWEADRYEEWLGREQW